VAGHQRQPRPLRRLEGRVPPHPCIRPALARASRCAAGPRRPSVINP
jgi:hypothetical protein